MEDKKWIVLVTLKTANYAITQPCEDMIAAKEFIQEEEELPELYPSNKLKSQRPGRADWRFDIPDAVYMYLAEWKPIRQQKRVRLV